ncbi:thiamine phosphate synthase [Sphingomonas sp.]|uniref:thiamine phosphate synthase n=1 Tax=Sphingomonas sp. TaxID=28214 RepID=UPI002DD692BE|nr:thiamine phosphate synthase [Sphingomonas sp.]
MPRRHPVPHRWLMTDERMGDALWDAIGRLPRGSGIVVRHHGWPMRARRALMARIAHTAKRKGLVVLGAGGLDGPGGSHNGRRRRGLVSRSVHSRPEMVAAIRAGADVVFVSPVFATRSHPGARELGVVRMAAIVRGAPMPVVALGGMSEARFRRVRGTGVHGWAGIDAWIETG